MADSVTDFIPDGSPFENPASAAADEYAKTFPGYGSGFEQTVSENPTGETGRLTKLSELNRAYEEGDPQGARQAAAISAGTPLDILPTYSGPKPVMITAEQAQDRYAPPGVKMFDGPVLDTVARVMGQQKTDEIKRDGILSRYAATTSWPTRVGTGFVAGLLDPINDAAAFVPGLGEETVLASLGRAGLSTSGAAARMAARGISAATGGAAGMLPLIGLNAGLAQAEGDAYGIRDAMRDMAMGASLGALFHAGFGAARELGALRPDGLVEAEAARRQAGIAAPAAEPGLVSDADIREVAAAPADVKSDAMNSAVSQLISGREVDVQPVFDVARANKAEQELQQWTAQQQRLDAETSAALRSAEKAEGAAGTIEGKASALQARLEDLQSQHAGFLADIAGAESRRAAQVDTVTPERLRTIDDELTNPATSSVRREQLEGEKALLTEGRDTSADQLEVARTEAELEGLRKGAAAIQAQMDATGRKIEPLQTQAAAKRTASASALGLTSARIESREGVVQALTARSLRRYAGAFSADLSRAEAETMARRIVGGGADEIPKALAEIRGRAKPGEPATIPPDVALPQAIPELQGNAAQTVADTAQRQQAIYRNGYSQGMPQHEFDALNDAVYGKAQAEGFAPPKVAETGGQTPSATNAENRSDLSTGPATEGDAKVAEWQQRFESGGVVPTAEERALLEATAARLEAADLAAQGYAQAAECLMQAGV